MHPPSLLWGTFHLSKLTGQKIPVIMIISLVIRTIHRDSKWHARRNGVSTKTLGKNICHCRNHWSGYGPAGQFWLLKSALCLSIIWKVTCKHQIWGRFNLYVLLLRGTFHTTPLFLYADKQVENKRQRKSTLRDNSRGLYHFFHHRQLLLELL